MHNFVYKSTLKTSVSLNNNAFFLWINQKFSYSSCHAFAITLSLSVSIKNAITLSVQNHSQNWYKTSWDKKLLICWSDWFSEPFISFYFLYKYLHLTDIDLVHSHNRLSWSNCKPWIFDQMLFLLDIKMNFVDHFYGTCEIPIKNNSNALWLGDSIST